MKIKFDKIPYILKNVPLAKETAISPIIPALEGTIVAVEAQDHEGKLNVLDFKSGYLGRLWGQVNFHSNLQKSNFLEVS